MDDKGEKAGSSPSRKGGAESRRERLAQALRANLKRRKQAGGARPEPGKDRKTGESGDTGS